MNHHELKAARMLLFFSIPEAAKWIGRVNVTTWRRWEAGKVPVPDDVEWEILALLVYREQALASFTSSKRDLGSPDSLDTWVSMGNQEKHWRPYQSAIAAHWAKNRAPRLL